MKFRGKHCLKSLMDICAEIILKYPFLHDLNRLPSDILQKLLVKAGKTQYYFKEPVYFVSFNQFRRTVFGLIKYVNLAEIREDRIAILITLFDYMLKHKYIIPYLFSKEPKLKPVIRNKLRIFINKDKIFYLKKHYLVFFGETFD